MSFLEGITCAAATCSPLDVRLHLAARRAYTVVVQEKAHVMASAP